MVVGAGNCAKSNCSMRGRGFWERLTVTSSNEGQAFIRGPSSGVTMNRVQAPSETHQDESIWTLRPNGVCSKVKPGQPVALVHSRQFSQTSWVILMKRFSA